MLRHRGGGVGRDTCYLCVWFKAGAQGCKCACIMRPPSALEVVALVSHGAGVQEEEVVTMPVGHVGPLFFHVSRAGSCAAVLLAACVPQYRHLSFRRREAAPAFVRGPA